MKFPQFKSLFLKSKNRSKELTQDIKFLFDDFTLLTKFANSYERELPMFKTLLFQSINGKNHLPKSFNELNRNENPAFTTSLIKELNWAALSIVKNKEIINKFLALKNQFENSLLLGKYTDARSLLDQIEREICVSFWSLENKLILDEYQFGTESNWATRNKILDDKNDVFVKALGNMFSIKCEKRLPFYQINDVFNYWIGQYGLLEDESYSTLVEYLQLKANFFSLDTYENSASFIFMEGNASIIDRYLVFVTICCNSVCNNHDKKREILNFLKVVFTDIPETSIRNLLTVYDVDYIPEISDFDIGMILILDNYTKGNYEECRKEIINLIITGYANSLELLELYAKTLVESNQPYVSITDTPTICENISKFYFAILQKSDSNDEALVSTAKLSYVFNNSSIGLHLYNFVSKELGWKNNLNYEQLSMIGSKFINPKIINCIFNYKMETESFVKKIEHLFPNSLTIKVYSQYLIDDNVTNTIPGIPLIKSKLYSLRGFLLKSNHAEVIKQYELLMLDNDNYSIISIHEIASNLFQVYLDTGNFREALVLYTTTYIKKQNLIKRMNYQLLLNAVIKGKFKTIGSIYNLIELPIFFRIDCEDKIRIKQAYELFLKGNNLHTVKDLLLLSDNFDKEKLIYFLKNVCTPEILQLSKSFDSTYAVNEERISVCKFLSGFDSDNQIVYNEEIADLTKKNTISKVIGGIDERKIYVNESKLRQIVLKPNKQNVFQNEQISPLSVETFERYLAISAFIKNNNEYKDLAHIFERNSSVLDSNSSKINIISIPAFKMFALFFIYIRDLYVYNKEYGLDAYLSTRIRHGTLPNHLRSVFEKNSLVTSQSDNVYSQNLYWAERMNINAIEMETIQKLLADFSSEVDEYSKQIKDRFVQCQSEKKPNEKGLLNFSYTEEELLDNYLEVFQITDSLDEFIDKAFIELWARTESCLEAIRNKFNTEFRSGFIDLLDKLHEQLLKLDCKDSIRELLSTIMICRTDIQNKLNNISKWFRRSESSFDGEYKLKILAETSIEIAKNIHPYFNFNVEIESIETTVKGDYHQHFIDLFNNLLFNMIKHSHVASEDLNAKLTITEKENYIYFNFKNLVDLLRYNPNNLEFIKLNWHKLDLNINHEGGTGLPKVKKIIMSDMNRKYSFFDYKLTGSTLEILLSFENKDL